MDEEWKAIQTLVSTTPIRTSARAIAIRKFNTHFLTLWHLTYLTSYNSPANSHFRVTTYAMGRGGTVWRRGFGDRKFTKFDSKLDVQLGFIIKEFAKVVAMTSVSNSVIVDLDSIEEAEVRYGKRCLVTIANYEKCLTLVEMLEGQADVEKIDVVDVCCKIVRFCSGSLADFKRNSLIWVSQFLFRVHQLLSLARNCYSIETGGHFQLNLLDKLFLEHANSTVDLWKHFIANTTSKNLNAENSEMFEPIVPLATLISTLNENAKCQAERIPTALTSIMHEYSYLDPFNLCDAESIQMKVAMSSLSTDQTSQTGQFTPIN